ncbi:MAG: L,D-transpeptidase [Polyangia bacterium]
MGVLTRRSVVVLALLLSLLAGSPAACRRGGTRSPVRVPAPASAPATPASAARAETPAPPSKPDPDALPEAASPAERRAIQVVAGQERVVDAEQAVKRGLTLVDLSDGWAPYIFQDGKAADGAILPNRYRAVFVGLANDRTDGDGQALPPGERNYLELYGIPPSLSVLRARFLADAARTCEAGVDNARLLAVDSIETFGHTTEKKEATKHRQRGLRLEAARAKAGAATLEALAAADPRYAGEVKTHQRVEAERAAFAEVEKRLVCEGLMDAAKHKPGVYDAPMRSAVLDFQQKNDVFAQADLTRATLEAMARPLLANDFATLRRVLAERAAHAGNFVEDGSAIGAMPPAKHGRPRALPSYRTADGKVVTVPDLVGQATDALMARLGLSSPEEALALFRRHPESDFLWLRAAVRFPDLPEYYGPKMDLVAEIDRGDVWYDFPFDSKGNRVPQSRNRFPTFNLYVRWRGDKVPLVSWRTTIGGWRSELASDGEEYYRYKESDVGKRVWRHIVSAPVWLPPPSSPLASMVKTKWVAGGYPRVVNYDETGPGFLSAYGLVAGIHVQAKQRGEGVAYFDNGIRTHGSSDYLSLRGRFSHGCHRLYNNLAVRLFSFVLKHRRAKVLGPMALGFRRTFYWDGEVFEMRLPTRGFYYELDPPLPVETLKGKIVGHAQQPMTDYVRKPGVTYANSNLPSAPTGPESKAGGGGRAEPGPEGKAP